MGSSSKTSKLKLNQWRGEDSPMRADFNNDNTLIDNAFVALENKVTANTNSITSTANSLRSELNTNIQNESRRLMLYAAETRAFAQDTYASLLLSNQSGVDLNTLDPAVTGVWVEQFRDLGDIDMSLGATNRNILTTGSAYLVQPRWGTRHVPTGSSSSTTSGVHGILFELDKPATITALTCACEWAEKIYAFGQYIWRATREADGSITLGERLYYRNLTSISTGSFANNTDDVARALHLEPGLYMYAMGGGGNLYSVSSYSSVNDEKNLPPEYSRVGYKITLSGSEPTAVNAVSGFVPHISVEWRYDDDSLPRILTKNLNFGHAAKDAVLYVYSGKDDLAFQATAIPTSGSAAVFVSDSDCQHVKVGNDLYLSRYTLSFPSQTEQFKLDMRFGSATGGTVKKLVCATLKNT